MCEITNKDQWPKISIVTPSYNQGQYIEETILSVINQNYHNLEYIIIDGGSTDNTIDIIKKYERHITYWISELDEGQSHAINKGLAKCTGEIFNWLNSDDFLEKNALFKIAETFRNSKSSLICGVSRRINSTGNVVDYVQTTLCDSIEKTIFFGSFRQGPSFFSTDAVRILGGVNEDLHYVMDSDLYLRYILMYGIDKIHLLNNVLINFRLHPSSKTCSEEDKFYKEFAPILDCMLRGEKPYESALINHERLCAYYHARKALNTSRYKTIKYVLYLLRSVGSYPGFSIKHLKFLLKEVALNKPNRSEVL